MSKNPPHTSMVRVVGREDGMNDLGRVTIDDNVLLEALSSSLEHEHVIPCRGIDE